MFKAKLPRAEIATKFFRDQMGMTEIAKEYGCSVSSISNIISAHNRLTVCHKRTPGTAGVVDNTANLLANEHLNKHLAPHKSSFATSLAGNNFETGESYCNIDKLWAEKGVEHVERTN